MHTKKNPKPSAVMIRLVDRSINGPYAAQAKEELLYRIGTMERNNSMFHQVNNALESILLKAKRLSRGRDLSVYSSPTTISGTVWWILNSIEMQEKENSVKKIQKIDDVKQKEKIVIPNKEFWAKVSEASKSIRYLLDVVIEKATQTSSITKD